MVMWLLSFLLVLVLVVLYWVPTIVAVAAKHHNVVGIAALNGLAGWSGVGWIVAMVWACTRPASARPVVVNVQNAPQPLRDDGAHREFP